ncbi:MAG: zinc ABC transporter substrate-binding protein [Proteobacteria bacterium]|nr:zinc ABC transporter substrate-binding protein [Pseudomonadota bacterium]MCG2740333.1 zinc ABC transporter substrate-binding protein [Syntrophaceae bacterium]
MWTKVKLFLAIVAIALLGVSTAYSSTPQEGNAKIVRGIVTSDTILSGMIASLLPPHRYSIEAILPPGQCPGHYDVKLADIEKTQKADLTVSFRGMPFMDKAGLGGRAQLLVDAGDRNWMAPDSYIYGLGVIADGLSRHFPEDKAEIIRRKEEAIHRVNAGANSLIEKIRRLGIFGKAIIASSMQKEPLEWMGFRVVGEYGRPEAMSAREVVRLSKIGREQQATAVVDNLQSGPDTGKGIAETLGVPHVVLTNFPSEKGYLATLGENVEAVAAAVMRK